MVKQLDLVPVFHRWNRWTRSRCFRLAREGRPPV